MGADIAKAVEAVGLSPATAAGYAMRPLAPNDSAALLTILNSSPDATWEHAPATPDYVQGMLGARFEHYAAYGFGVLGVEDGSGRLIGQAGLRVYDPETDAVEVVMFLAAPNTGKGIGAELLRYILSRVDGVGMTRLYAATRLENDRAQRLLARFGFRVVREETHFDQACVIWCRQAPDGLPTSTARS